MLLIKIDNEPGIPRYLQIFEAIKSRIESGQISAGQRLPASRVLAVQLGVNRSTVIRAYEELWAKGYVETYRGGFTQVRLHSFVDSSDNNAAQTGFDWERHSSPFLKTFVEKYRSLGYPQVSLPRIDFRTLAPDSRLFPVERFRKCMQEVLAFKGRDLLQYGNAAGYLPLRQFIATRLRLHGIPCQPEEVLISHGIQNALELCIRALCGAGSRVVVEQPTYSHILPLLELYHIQPLGVSMRPEGMDTDELECLLSREKIAFVYTMPNFHNPMGITSSQAHRERLLEVCRKYAVPLIEDGFEEELKYMGKAILPLKAMDTTGQVIYLGTFSKVLFPGLRIAWVVAPTRFLDTLSTLKQVGDISGNMLSQASLELFCRKGYYDTHIRKVHRVYRKRMETALKAIKKCLPSDRFHFIRPVGGYTIWFEMSNPEVIPAFVDQLAANGVAVSPGNQFFIAGSQVSGFRVSIAQCDDKQIEEGFRLMAQTIKTITR